MTLVLLHAFPLDSRIWEHQKTALGDEFAIVAPDLRGFGNAGAELGELSEIPIDLAADDVIRLLDSRGIEKAAVAGISRGGYIALSLSRRYPERLSALVLMDTRANPADEKEKQSSTELIRRVEFEGIAVVPELMGPRLLRPTSSEALVREVHSIILSQRPEAVIAASRGMTNRPDARPGLPGIQAPCLAIAGVEDAAFENTREIAGTIPGAEFLAVPDAGHLSHMEQPAIVEDALRKFLRSVGGA